MRAPPADRVGPGPAAQRTGGDRPRSVTKPAFSHQTTGIPVLVWGEVSRESVGQETVSRGSAEPSRGPEEVTNVR